MKRSLLDMTSLFPCWDTDKSVAGAYGTLGPLGFLRRSVFICDADLTIRYAHRAMAGLTYRPVSELVHALQEISE